jgi:hypothetical protein
VTAILIATLTVATISLLASAIASTNAMRAVNRTESIYSFRKTGTATLNPAE